MGGNMGFANAYALKLFPHFAFLGFTSSASTNPFDSQTNDDFAAVFGQPAAVDSTPAMGDILVPTVSSTGKPAPAIPVENNVNTDQSGSNLHASLDRVAKSLGEMPQMSLHVHVCLLHLQAYTVTGVSIKIEVASRFEWSNRLNQWGAVGPLFLGGVGGGSLGTFYPRKF